MFLLLPVTGFLLCIPMFLDRARPVRAALLYAAVAWGALVVATSEMLSLLQLFNFAGLVVAWVLIDAALFVVTLLRRPWPIIPGLGGPPYTPGELGMLACILTVVLVVGVIAVIAAPNTWDAMESHLPRAFFWAQNQTISFYPSPHFLQNIATPFSQLAIAQSFILLGNDYAANSLQFFSMVGSTIAASLVARELGGLRGAQILAALICATIPEGILEASGVQNTYGGALWIVAAVYFLLRLQQDTGWINLLSLAGAVGLALMTKGTAYTLLPPILLALWFAAPRPQKWLLLRTAPILAAVVILLNSGFYLRNYALTGTPLGVPYPEAGQLAGGYANATYTLGGTTANVLRNISLHLAMPGLDKILAPAFAGAMRAMGQDPDDPTHTWPERGFQWPHLSLHEIWAGNPVHLLLAAVSLVILLGQLHVPGARVRLLYALGLVGAFVLFCAMLRYTIFSSRYHIPLFVLASPLTAVVLWERIGPRRAMQIGFVLFVIAVPFLVANKLRALVPGAPNNILALPRADIYFADSHMDEAPAFQAAVASLDNDPCRTIGILADLPAPESTLVISPPAFYVYPALALLHARDPKRQFAYVGVHNSSAQYRMPEIFRPCAIICLDCARDAGAGAEFALTQRRTYGDIVVLTSSSE
jgi:hypothetical protein